MIIFNEKQTLSRTIPIPRLTVRRPLVEDWGEMTTTNGDYGNSRLSLIDEGGDCYQDYDSKSHDEALQKAEKWLREVDFPERMDKETIDSLEEDYALYKLNS